MTKPIGELLIEKGLITPEQLTQAIKRQKTVPRPLGEILVADGVITENQLAEALSEQLSIPFVDVEYYSVDKEVVAIFPKEFLFEHLVIPLFKMQNAVTVAMADPLDLRTVDRLRAMAQCDIQPVFGTPLAITKLLDRFYGADDSLERVIENIPPSFAAAARPSVPPGGGKRPEEPRSDVKELARVAERTPIIKLVDAILKEAVGSRASDIHFEPDDGTTHLRFRIDGVLYDMSAPPKRLEASVISRIKIMANLDIAERRLPQDGRFQIKLRDREVDFRVSTFPTIHGENVAIRVLDKSAIVLSLGELGFLPEALRRFQGLIQRPNGIILVTGPTGCGKTTTLYAALRMVDAVKRNVITLEDPVEYRIPRIRQSQIDVKAGLTFASGLRSIVRQDPDVIMIGEIRDLETAQIAIHAALTGHLVFSTLHTNDAPGAMARLIDMGVEPFLIASSVMGVLAQRLVRTLCPICRKPDPLTPQMLSSLGLKELPPKTTIFRSQGCRQCKESGYQGRSGIFELLEMSDALRKLVVAKASSSDVRLEAIRNGIRSLRQAGVAKVLEGTTTIEEVLRVTEYELPS